MINSEDPLTAFVIALLDDDNGISEDTFEKLITMLVKQNQTEMLRYLFAHVDSADGRFWLPGKIDAQLCGPPPEARAI